MMNLLPELYHFLFCEFSSPRYVLPTRCNEANNRLWTYNAVLFLLMEEL